MKEITFWCPFIGKVGTINAVLQSAKALSETKQYKSKIVNVFGELDDYKKFLTNNNIQEIKLVKNRYLKNFPSEGLYWSRIKFILIIIFSFIPLLLYLRKNRDDILIIYLLTSLPLFLKFFFGLKNKIFFRISGKINFNLFRKIFYYLVRKKIDKILVQTNDSKKKILYKEIFHKSKVVFCYDPIIDLKKINILKKQKIEAKFRKIKFFIAIGRLTRQKNFSFLVNAFSKSVNFNHNYKLLILGDGSEKKGLERLIKKLKMKKKIFLLGYKKNIFKYLSKSEGLMCTSLWEEPGFIIQEAAACKKIILSSNCPSGPEEFLAFGKDGYIFKSNIEISFLNQFKKLLIEKTQHKKKINANYKKIFRYEMKNYIKTVSNII